MKARRVSLVLSLLLPIEAGCSLIENPNLTGQTEGSTSGDGTTEVATPEGDTTGEDPSTAESATGTSGPSTADSTSTGAPAICGDGVVEGDEECDGSDLNGATCEGEGTLACSERCTYDFGACSPAPPALTLSVSAIKQFDFTWAAVDGAEYYQLEQSLGPGEPFVLVADGIGGESVSLTVALHLRHQASYRLLACNAAGCTSSQAVSVMGSLAEAVGYIKASHPDSFDYFDRVALSSDGSTLAVGAYLEDGGFMGVDNDNQPPDESAMNSGAVYVFVNDGAGTWSQQAYIKATDTQAGDRFGWSVTLSADGSTLAVGAPYEVGTGGTLSGAVYVYTRDLMDQWASQAYLQACNANTNHQFGSSVALSADGNTLAVGAPFEGSNTEGVVIDCQSNNAAVNSGAAHVFERDPMGTWSHEVMLKPFATTTEDQFGSSVALSGDGNTVAVGAPNEDGSATDVGGAIDNAAANAGAAYVFVRTPMQVWQEQAYVKASNTASEDHFGISVALSGSGDMLAVGAPDEDSGNMGMGPATDSGAVYLYERSVGWSPLDYVKSSNPDPGDQFGLAVALNENGALLVVGAPGEDSSATGIEGSQADGADNSGAAYVFGRDPMGQLVQRAYVKASNTGGGNGFGDRVAMSGDGETLVIGAIEEDGGAGAAYLY